jgi:glycosyltransferase involved in cell wall biosynthesis
MKIAFDATYSVGGNLSGVGVYSREILTGMATAHPEEQFALYYRPHRFAKSFSQSLPANCRRRLLFDAVPPLSADVFHGLNQRLPRKPPRRSVATFHDLFVLTAEYSTPEFRRRFEQQARQAAANSDLIIAVSEFTGRQVEDLLGIERSRIRVIPHGVRFPGVGGRTGEREEREKMVLHVGAVQKRKNIARLVRAFESLPPEWTLVLAGSFGYGFEEILRAIEQSARRAAIRLAGYVDDREVARLYRRASVFAFPSLDEGFGMPVLEAMVWGVPVITSNRSALPEVAGDAALLVDPLEVDDIARGLRQLALDRDLQLEFSRRGKLRAAAFTWQAAVSRTFAVYRELAGSN